MPVSRKQRRRGKGRGATSCEAPDPTTANQLKKNKNKKWTPLHLLSHTEDSDSSTSFPSSDSQYHNRQCLTAEELPSEYLELYDNHLGETFGFEKGKGKELEVHESFDSNTKGIFVSDFERHNYLGDSEVNSIIHEGDSQDTKDKLEIIMARIDEALDLDSEEWFPDIGVAGPSRLSDTHSVTAELGVTSQPETGITYTTVGSVAKSNAAPQFTAPIRLQREGAGRRYPVAPINSRGLEKYNHRGHQSGANTFWGQQHSQNVPRFSPQQSVLPYTISEMEQEIILQSLGVSAPSVRSANVPAISLLSSRSGNVRALAGGMDPTADPFKSTINSKAFDDHGMSKEDKSSQPLGLQTSLLSSRAGLDKMQTLRRLAQFENPMQKLAKERLSGFSVTKLQQSASNSSNDGSVQSLGREPPVYSGNDENAQVTMQSGPTEQGYLDYRFRFPKRDDSFQSNIISTSTSTSTNTNSAVRALPKPLPRGYPQPLTAGPPGQRQFGSGLVRPSLRLNRESTTDSASASVSERGTTSMPYSPWTSSFGPFSRPAQNSFRSGITRGDPIRDTLPLEAIAKYYPNGFAVDMYGHHSRLDDCTSEIDTGGNSKNERQIKEAEQDEWWFSGLRRFNMTAEDHLQELEAREPELYTLQPPIQRPKVVDREIVTVEDLKKMTTAECAEPMLDSLFGTFLSYADEIPTPTNKALLSRFVKAPVWAIDYSLGGNQSFYGEDWGKAPRRLGRDPRYLDYTEEHTRRYETINQDLMRNSSSPEIYMEGAGTTVTMPPDSRRMISHDCGVEIDNMEAAFYAQGTANVHYD